MDAAPTLTDGLTEPSFAPRHHVCREPGCSQPAYSPTAQYCSYHAEYHRMLRNFPASALVGNQRKCKVDGCTNPVRSKCARYCEKHAREVEEKRRKEAHQRAYEKYQASRANELGSWKWECSDDCPFWSSCTETGPDHRMLMLDRYEALPCETPTVG